MRARHKEWKNGKYPKWTCRIIWFEGKEETDIRLQLEDCEIKKNVFPSSQIEADAIWDLFRSMAPPSGEETPFVQALLADFGEKS